MHEVVKPNYESSYIYKIKQKPIQIITSYCRKKFQTNKTRIYYLDWFSFYFTYDCHIFI